MPKVSVGDAEIAWDERGEGSPLLFVMGFTGSRHHWLGFPDRFADRHRVITFDNRGVGESSAPPGPYAIATMAKDALAVLDAAGVKSATVMGVSMGGMIAQELAIAAPDRVEKLVLGCTSFGGPAAIPVGEDAVQLFQGIGKMPADRVVRLLLEINFTDAWAAAHPDVIEGLVAHGTTHKMPRQGFWGQLGAIGFHDTSTRVAAVRAPTLVIAGDVDRLIPPENSGLIAKRIAGAELAMLPGVGHMFWVEAADEAERRIRAFLGELPRKIRANTRPMLGRATVSQWQREEDGSYKAEMNGWTLHVAWTPEPPKGGPYGFSWKAEGPKGEKAKSEELLEEIEVAMMQAENVATHGHTDTNEGGAG